MEPSETANSDIVDPHVSAGKTSTTDLRDGLDLARLNDLLLFVREKLTTDVYGNFHISGDRLAKDGRHTQLKEVVELSERLAAVATILHDKQKDTAMESAKTARKAGRPSAVQLRTTVQQEMETFLRDRSIEYERVEERFKHRVQKVEAQMEKAKAERAAAEKQRLDMEQKYNQLLDRIVDKQRALDDRIRNVLADKYAALTDGVYGLEEREMDVQKRLSWLEDGGASTEDKLTQLEAKIDSRFDQMGQKIAGAKATADSVYKWAVQHEQSHKENRYVDRLANICS